ncbi:hypothetical protein SAMN06265338_104211 [Rhodoblastus acidophilus]|uniref:Uncharacterized protein n=1 Tax=Rhodoblastus acidophilus TaxID=1074 RepID=A0A212RHR2_RHOAC|nr:hypothetical protein SAMN06265338_104211 [Rhodoblastus acidophilus]
MKSLLMKLGTCFFMTKQQKPFLLLMPSGFHQFQKNKAQNGKLTDFAIIIFYQSSLSNH